MPVPGEGFNGLRFEYVSPEQEELAREVILEDCLRMKAHGVIEAYAALAGPMRVDEVSEQVGVPTTDPRFELQLTLEAANWADQRIEDWSNASPLTDKEIAMICRVYGLSYGRGYYYDDLLGVLMDARDDRREKLARHRDRLSPFDETLADMWAKRAYPQNPTNSTIH